MFKKIYLEITNNCNLDCDFCIKNKRKNMFMQESDFKEVLKNIKGYTKYLYFHVLGEPLLHPNINEFIDIASKDYFVNITTNGYLIKRIENNKNIRQINISFHSFSDKYKKTLEDYLNDIFEVVDILKETTYVSYRLWVNSFNKERIIQVLENKYQCKIVGNMTLEKNVFIDFADSFIWPDIKNNLNNVEAGCYGLIDHLGILVDGTIVPCCLDTMGVINLGNIYKDNLGDVLKQKRVQDMINNFRNKKKCEELCKHCGFIIDKRKL